MHRSGRVPTPSGVVDLVADVLGLAERLAVVIAELDVRSPRAARSTGIHGREQHDPAGLQVHDRRRVAAGGDGIRVGVGTGQDDLLGRPGPAVVLGAAYDQVDLLGVATVGTARFGEGEQGAELGPDDRGDAVAAVPGEPLVEEDGLGDGGAGWWRLLGRGDEAGTQQEERDEQAAESGHGYRFLPSDDRKVNNGAGCYIRNFSTDLTS